MAEQRHPLTVPFAAASALALLQTILAFRVPDLIAWGLGMALAYGYCRWALERPVPDTAPARSQGVVAAIALLIGLYLVLGFGWSMLLLLAIASLAFKSEWVWNLLKEFGQALMNPSEATGDGAIAAEPEPAKEAPEPVAPVEAIEAVVPEVPAEPTPTVSELPTSSLDGWGLESSLSAGALTPAAWESLSSSNSGFEEALAMLQGRPVKESPKS